MTFPIYCAFRSANCGMLKAVGIAGAVTVKASQSVNGIDASNVLIVIYVSPALRRYRNVCLVRLPIIWS